MTNENMRKGQTNNSYNNYNRELPGAFEKETSSLKRFYGIVYTALGPAGFVLLGTCVLIGGTPIITRSWNIIWLLVGILVIILGTQLYLLKYHTLGTSKSRTVGIILGIVLLLAVPLGLTSQRTFRGEVQLHNSSTDKQLHFLDDAATSFGVLTETQGLLYLTREQALTFGDIFQQAIVQSQQISRKWNVALGAKIPNDDYRHLADLLSKTAAIQSEGLQSYLSDLITPEIYLENKVIAANLQLAVLLGSGPDSVYFEIVRLEYKLANPSKPGAETTVVNTRGND
jgi:hypothetical protein